ncbi:MAG: hypothetical protein ABSA30_12730 [Candidatus Aminicenantales bacterium]|jgi:hypothetical protein
MTEIATIPTVHDLRRRWKPHKERLAALGGEQPTAIRFHRACSWMARVEAMPDGQDHDLALISLWIAFNSLYGQWDCQKREPRPDRECWRAFIDRILRLDRDGHVAAMLLEHKRLALALFDDEYVSAYFWQEPTVVRAKSSRKAAHNAHTWYIEQRWTQILDEILARVYVMRCQLVHGAATYGGKLNRTSLKHCVTIMQKLLPALLGVWIDHGADEGWGPMCYPPLTNRPVAEGGRPRTPR